MNIDNASIKFHKSLFVEAQMFCKDNGYLWNFECYSIITFEEFMKYNLSSPSNFDYESKNIFYLNTYS